MQSLVLFVSALVAVFGITYAQDNNYTEEYNWNGTLSIPVDGRQAIESGRIYVQLPSSSTPIDIRIRENVSVTLDCGHFVTLNKSNTLWRLRKRNFDGDLESANSLISKIYPDDGIKIFGAGTNNSNRFLHVANPTLASRTEQSNVGEFECYFCYYEHNPLTGNQEHKCNIHKADINIIGSQPLMNRATMLPLNLIRIGTKICIDPQSPVFEVRVVCAQIGSINPEPSSSYTFNNQPISTAYSFKSHFFISQFIFETGLNNLIHVYPELLMEKNMQGPLNCVLQNRFGNDSETTKILYNVTATFTGFINGETNRSTQCPYGYSPNTLCPRIGQQVNLNCSTNYNNPYNVIFPNSSIVTNRNLSFIMKPTDFGSYTCTSCNDCNEVSNTIVFKKSICDLPKESGPCLAYFERWYYNGRSGLCEKFIYGGCRSNSNNFMTLSDCLQTCAEGNKTCPGDVDIVECYSDPCQTSHCTNYEDAVCIPNHCGECSAHYYNSSGHNVTMMCNNCPPEKPAVRCITNPCDHETCPNLPPTKCQLDVCGSCMAHHYLNGTEVTDICNACPADGQIFKNCGGSCERTCDDVLSQDPFICDVHYCVPDCGCPAGQVLDKSNQRCVYPDQCLCTGQCDPIPNNCSSISYDECNCSICQDCSIDGQLYHKEEASCPKTCSNRYLLCSGDTKPGCSCPEGQLIDEMKNQCVNPDDCSKVNPCTLDPQPGPCTASITRYYYNYTTETCQEFTYSGCFPNENNFLTQHDCEEKCSDCYPVCTREYCFINRRATCSLPSSLPGSVKECPGGCTISNCGACYYSYNDLPIPNVFRGCPTHCPVTNTTVDESCMQFWGTCIEMAYNQLYEDVPTHEKIKDNFRCWEHPCHIP
ncbi:PREDICTED: uncharacterized protein LOC105314215 isoform X1 [Amphimedon queenslandica]|uniref:BPTI/Kunitz inhibitor domain-containing protein n=1 Tax=Amphimedon queenslandica TaxID=400682 RepID=A0A1X7TXY5_AMPQE|nr:PREDICTED: uncharacterized protein LOC105314215 isoform X1 [Amphimedon queenslandica]|eukprot:XP_019857134.1 PREDICTED: uncharacterized protein LOC105314215 isoform X1 [Amphimedon queenslandica]